jgi:type VI secretion system secreted protein Hcp
MAAVDYFLKIDGIKGESQDKTHKDEIDIVSFSWGMAQQGTASKGGGMGAGKVAVKDIVVVKEVDASSPKLFDACFTGKHIPSAQLTCRKAGGSAIEYWTVKLTDILISSVHQQPPNAGAMHFQSADQPVAPAGSLLHEEVVTINYSAYEASYKGQQHDGTAGGAVTSKGNVKTDAAG